jgi:hypothetical protein
VEVTQQQQAQQAQLPLPLPLPVQQLLVKQLLVLLKVNLIAELQVHLYGNVTEASGK